MRNHDGVTTLEESVGRVERLYGKTNRIWEIDRGMISDGNVRICRKPNGVISWGRPRHADETVRARVAGPGLPSGARWSLGTVLPGPWRLGGEGLFLLSQSAQRKDKEQAMHDRFEKRIEEGLEKIAASCRKRKQWPVVVAQRVGRLLGRNSRAA